jgi:uncharacterized protein (TIGR00369 family)
MNEEQQSNMQNTILQELTRAYTKIPFNQMLGLTIDHIDPQYITVHFNMKNELVGNFIYGILHGGVISSVLDMAGGIAVMSSGINKHPDYTTEQLIDVIGKCTTVDLHVSFLSPGKGDSFKAKAWIVKSGHQISFTQMELRNQEETLVATAMGTYLMR